MIHEATSEKSIMQTTLQMTEKRRESLIEIMDAIWDINALPLYEVGFRMTPEIAKAEDLVVQLQSEVKAGRAKLADYRRAVEGLVNEIKKSTNSIS